MNDAFFFSVLPSSDFFFRRFPATVLGTRTAIIKPTVLGMGLDLVSARSLPAFGLPHLKRAPSTFFSFLLSKGRDFRKRMVGSQGNAFHRLGRRVLGRADWVRRV